MNLEIYIIGDAFSVLLAFIFSRVDNLHSFILRLKSLEKSLSII